MLFNIVSKSRLDDLLIEPFGNSISNAAADSLIAALTVHRDLDAILLEVANPDSAGELRDLLGVEDRRTAISRNRPLLRLNTKIGIRGVRQSPRQYLA